MYTFIAVVKCLTFDIYNFKDSFLLFQLAGIAQEVSYTTGRVSYTTGRDNSYHKFLDKLTNLNIRYYCRYIGSIQNWKYRLTICNIYYSMYKTT